MIESFTQLVKIIIVVVKRVQLLIFIQINEKMQYTSNASREILCSNNFNALSRTMGKKVKLTKNDNNLTQEKQVSHTILNRKLSLEALIF